MGKKKSWKEKLNDSKDLPKVIKIDEKMSKKWGKGTCVIPAPVEVDAIMKKVPAGEVITINDIRKTLAEKHGTNIACPITTGIFARIAAGAAGEDAEKGKKRITPYWRTLKTGGLLNGKYPGGIKRQMELLEKEGHTIIPKGKNDFIVLNYDKYTVKLKI